MSEEQYFEKDFRWERGLFRAPDGVLLFKSGIKYLHVEENQKQRILREWRVAVFLGWGLLAFSVIASMLYTFTDNPLPKPITGQVLLGAIFFTIPVFIFSPFFISRGLKRISVVHAGFVDSLKLKAQQTPYWVSWSLITVVMSPYVIFYKYTSVFEYFWGSILVAGYWFLFIYLRWKQDIDFKKKAG